MSNYRWVDPSIYLTEVSIFRGRLLGFTATRDPCVGCLYKDEDATVEALHVVPYFRKSSFMTVSVEMPIHLSFRPLIIESPHTPTGPTGESCRKPDPANSRAHLGVVLHVVRFHS